MKAAELERNEFKRQHGLRREARTMSPGTRAVKLGLLAVLVVIEVVINGNFLAKSNELGWLGGIVEAAVFAVLNISSVFPLVSLCLDN